MSSHSALTKLNLKKHLYTHSNTNNTGYTDLTLIGTTAQNQTTDNHNDTVYNVHKYDTDDIVGESTDTLLTTRTEVPRTVVPAATPSATLKQPLNNTFNDSKQIKHRPSIKYDNVKSKLFESTQALKLRAEAMKHSENIDTYKSNKPTTVHKHHNSHKKSNKQQSEVDAVVSRFYKLIDAQENEQKDSTEHTDNNTDTIQLIQHTINPDESVDFDKHAELINQSMQQLQQKKLQLEHKRQQAKVRFHYNNILQDTTQQYEHELQVQLIALQQSKQQTYNELNNIKATLAEKIKQLQAQLNDVEQQTYKIDAQYKQCVNDCKQQYNNTINNLTTDIQTQIHIELQKLDTQYSNVYDINNSLKLNNANGIT